LGWPFSFHNTLTEGSKSCVPGLQPQDADNSKITVDE
jgi:hypothetical protein